MAEYRELGSVEELLEWARDAPPGVRGRVLVWGEVYGDEDRAAEACRFMRDAGVVACSVTYSADMGMEGYRLVGLTVEAWRKSECQDCAVESTEDRIVIRTGDGNVYVVRSGGAGGVYVGEVDGYKVYADSGYLERFYRYLEMDALEVYRHPLSLAAFALNYIIVNPELKIEWRAPPDDFLEWRGLFMEDNLGVYVNPAYYDLAGALTVYAPSVATAREIAEDLIHTTIHEAAHYHDHINGLGTEGTWAGNPLAALLGIPSPAGGERSAEDMAERVTELIMRDERALRLVEDYVQRSGRNAFGGVEETVEALRELDLLNQIPEISISWSRMYYESEWDDEEEMYRDYTCVAASVEIEHPPVARGSTFEETYVGIFDAARVYGQKGVERLQEIVRRRGFSHLRVVAEERGMFGLVKEPAVCLPTPFPETYERVSYED